MTLYQLAIVGFSAFMLLSALSRVSRKKQSWREFIVWLLFWGSFAFLGLYPSTLDKIARVIGLADGVRALYIVSILLLFFFIFQILIRLEKQEGELTRFVRHEALKELQK